MSDIGTEAFVVVDLLSRAHIKLVQVGMQFPHGVELAAISDEKKDPDSGTPNITRRETVALGEHELKRRAKGDSAVRRYPDILPVLRASQKSFF